MKKETEIVRVRVRERERERERERKREYKKRMLYIYKKRDPSKCNLIKIFQINSYDSVLTSVSIIP